MNYLAHFHLAGDDPGLLVGALLGDFVKGSPDSETFAASAAFKQLPENTRLGVLLHRRIDARFDNLEDVSQFRQELEQKHRRLHGIAQDLLFDHLLARNWSRYHALDLEHYCDGVFNILAQHERHFGEDARRFSERLRQHRLPTRYLDEAQLLAIAARIAARWGMEGEMNALLESLLNEELPRAERHFQRVYPQMQAISEQWKRQNLA